MPSVFVCPTATIMIYPISLTDREKEIAGNSNAMSSRFA